MLLPLKKMRWGRIILRMSSSRGVHIIWNVNCSTAAYKSVLVPDEINHSQDAQAEPWPVKKQSGGTDKTCPAARFFEVLSN